MFNEHWANKDQFPTDIDEELEKKNSAKWWIILQNLLLLIYCYVDRNQYNE